MNNEKLAAGLASDLNRELEAQRYSNEQFKKEYMCTFEPDPQVEECVKFLRRSLPEDIRIAKRDSYFSEEVFKEAKRILNSV